MAKVSNAFQCQYTGYLKRSEEIEIFVQQIKNYKRANRLKENIDEVSTMVGMMKSQASNLSKMVDDLKQQVGTAKNKLGVEFSEESKNS